DLVIANAQMRGGGAAAASSDEGEGEAAAEDESAASDSIGGVSKTLTRLYCRHLATPAGRKLGRRFSFFRTPHERSETHPTHLGPRQPRTRIRSHPSQCRLLAC